MFQSVLHPVWCDGSDEHRPGPVEQDSDLSTEVRDGSSPDTDAVEVCDKLKACY